MKIKIETDGRTDNAKTICPADLSQAGHKNHQLSLSVFETAATDTVGRGTQWICTSKYLFSRNLQLASKKKEQMNILL